MGHQERSTIFDGEADRDDRFRPGDPPEIIDLVVAPEPASSTTCISQRTGGHSRD